MNIAFTVAPGRFTPDDEFDRLAALVVPALSQVADVELWRPEPQPWMAYAAAETPGEPPEGTDLVVGFDLSPGFLNDTGYRWTDIRRHPIHFDGRTLWSLVDSWYDDVVDKIAAACAVEVAEPEPGRLGECGSAGLFAAQISFDQALMRGGRLLRPDDVMDGLRAFAHRFEVLYVAPHPGELSGPWVEAALSIPNAILSPWSTYDALRRVRDVAVVTSSVGFEAPYFGVRTTWLAAPPRISAPIERLDEVELWSAVLEEPQVFA